jgi:hypothetical protein
LDRKAASEVDKRARLENVWLRRPITTIVCVGALSALFFIPARRVKFDYNLLHMQSAGLPAVIFQEKLLQSSTKSVVYAIVVAHSLSEATNLTARLTNLTTVAHVDSMAAFLAEDSTEKLKILTQVKAVASDIRFLPVDLEPVSLGDLNVSLYGLLGYTRLKRSRLTMPSFMRC